MFDLLGERRGGRITDNDLVASLHVAQQIKGGKFKIAGGASNSRVSWQITGTPRGKLAAEKRSNEQINAKQMQKHRDQMTAYAKLVESNRRRDPRAR